MKHFRFVIPILGILLSFPWALNSEELPLPENYTVENASYNIAVNNGLNKATLSFSLKITVHTDKWCEIKLASTRYQVSLAAVPKLCILTKDNKQHKLLFQKAGAYNISGTIPLKVEKENEAYKLVAPVIPATFASTEITMPGTNLGIQLKPDMLYRKKEKGKATVITFNSETTDEFTVLWGDREIMEQRLDGILLDSTMFASVENGLITTDTSLDFNITNRFLSRISLLLTGKTTLLKVEGENLNRWFIEKGADGDILNVFLHNAVSEGRYSLRLVTETPFEFDKPTRIQPIKESNIPKQNGLLLISVAKDLDMTIDETDNLQQIDVRAVNRRANMAYRWENPSAQLTASISQKVPRVYAKIEMLHTLKPSFVIARVKTSWEIKNTGINAVAMQIPENFSVISADGPAVKTYYFKDKVLKVLFNGFLLGNIDFTVELQSPCRIGEPFVLEPIIPDNVIGFETALAVKPDNLESKIESIQRMNQLSPEQLPGWLKDANPAFAFQSNQNDWQVKLINSLLKPEVELAVYEHLYKTENTLSRETQLDFMVRKEALFNLDIVMPDDFAPAQVNSSGLKIWEYDNSSHTLKITFTQGIKDRHTVKITSSPASRETTDTLAISPLNIRAPLKKIATYLAISTGPGVSLKISGSLHNISELSIDKLPLQVLSLANQAPLGLAFYSLLPDWSVGLAVISEPVQIDAVVSTALAIRPGQLRAFNLVDYSVKGLRSVNYFRVKLPPGTLNPEFRGEYIRNMEEKDGVWEIKLRQKVGSYRLVVVYEKALTVEPESAEFSPLQPVNASLNQSTVVLASDNPRDEVSITEKENVQVSNTTEMKIADDILAWLPTQPVYFVSYASEKARLKLKVTAHELNQTLLAKIYDSNLYSRLHDNGELITYFHMKIENKGKQNLTVTLPSGTILWGAYLNDKPVKPTRKETGKLLIPLMAEKTAETPPEGQLASLVVVYIQDIKKLSGMKKLSLSMPQTDLNINNAAWHLFLPSGYYLTSQSGNMDLVLEDRFMGEPSLAGIVGSSALSFIRKAWAAIPPIAKRLAFYLLLFLAFIVVAIIILKILRAVISRLHIKLQPLLRWAVFAPAATVVLFWLFYIFISSSTVGMKKSAESNKIYAVKSVQFPYANNAPPHDDSLGMDLPRDIITESAPVWKDAEETKRSETADNEDLSLMNMESRKDERYQKVKERLTKRGDLKELEEMEKKVDEYKSLSGESSEGDSYDFVSDKPLKGKGVNDTMGVGSGSSPRGGRRRLPSPPVSKPEPSPQPQATPVPLLPPDGSTATLPLPVEAPSPSDVYQPKVQSGWLETPQSPQVFSRTRQGRSKGALAISVSLPIHQTDYYRFQSTYLGKAIATISFTTLSTSMILFLQLLICLLMAGAALFLVPRYNPLHVIVGLAGAIILLFIAQSVAGGFAHEFLRTAFWFAIILGASIALILGKKLLSLNRQ
ncbi:MAG: hypothetical protein HY811_08400 [Planctomycetes bacterium]|nr:hypothetical protein [Planctomycetota bacterium]